MIKNKVLQKISNDNSRFMDPLLAQGQTKHSLYISSKHWLFCNRISFCCVCSLLNVVFFSLCRVVTMNIQLQCSEMFQYFSKFYSFHHFYCLLENIRETLCCKSEWNIYLDYSITLAKKCPYVQTISNLMKNGRHYCYQIIHTSLALRA